MRQMIYADDQITRGRVFKIESLNTHNGPGYRTVIYMKGCPLNCLWCHNPEGISTQKEIWISHAKCIGCLSCVAACPKTALSEKEGQIEVDRLKCIGCYECFSICPSKAIEKIGEDYSVDSIMERLRKDKAFMDASGGGVTLTGGEPGTAPGFVSELFKRCREIGIHTAFDTSGYISEKSMEMIIPYTDLVFFDLKILDNKSAKEWTGVGIHKILKSLQWIKIYKEKNDGPELQIRTPIIPGATDSDENLNAIAQFIKRGYSDLLTEWEINLFNDICEDKYQRMNKDWDFKEAKFDEKNYERIEQFSSEHANLNVRISGFLQK